MLKKIFLVMLIAAMIFILASCSSPSAVWAETSNYKAIVLLPDGTVMRGKCNDYTRISGNWIYVNVDGVKYRTNDWRVTLIENKD